MTKLKISISLLILLAISGVSYATTLDDIKTNVKNNWNAIDDTSCTSSITYTNGDDYAAVDNWSDISNANFYQKGDDKFRVDGTGQDSRRARCNGSTVWYDDTGTSWDDMTYATYLSRGANDKSILDFNSIIDDNTWTLDEETHDIGGITCYLIESTNFDMYVDTATKTKVYKIVRNMGAVTEYVMLSGYSEIESTAYLPNAMTHYWDSSSAAMSFSSIDINESLADSFFAVP